MKIIMPILKTILEVVTFLLAIIGIINLYNNLHFQFLDGIVFL